MLVIELKSNAGIEALRYEIVKQACQDYELALSYLRGKEKSLCDEKYLQMVKLKNDCENFFRSEHYGILCSINGEVMMEQIRRKFYNRPIRWGKE